MVRRSAILIGAFAFAAVLACAQGTITTFAGNGVKGFSGDGGPATGAALNFPSRLLLDAAGNLWIADGLNARIRKVSPDGIITTVAGNGTVGFSGDGGQAPAASLSLPQGLALDSSGNLYITERNNHRIRKVTPAGIITTIAGRALNSGEAVGVSPDGGQAVNTPLYEPLGILVDAGGNILFADSKNHRIRRISPSGIVTSVAGSSLIGIGVSGFAGDGGLATSAVLKQPSTMIADSAGNLWISDWMNNRIRRVTPNGIINTVAGQFNGCCGDGGPATSARLNSPFGIAVDGQGNLYIADATNDRIRKVGADGIINTIVGTGSAGYSGDGGSPRSAQLSQPMDVVVDAAGNLYIADAMNHRVRKVTFSDAVGPPTFTSAGVTNGASFAAGLTPGSIATVFGVNLTKGFEGILVATTLPLPRDLKGTSVTMNGTAAPLFAMANVNGAEQINLQVPYELAGQSTAAIVVNNNGVSNTPVQVSVLTAHPGIFTVDGTAGAILHGADNQLVTASKPAAKGEVVVVYATGLGPVSSPPQTGQGASGSTLSLTTTSPGVIVGGLPAEVAFSGLAPGFVGLYQVNLRVPPNAPSGNLDVVITAGSQASKAVKLAVQ